MSRTTHETTKALLKSILTKLEKQEMIALIPEKRLIALDEVYPILFEGKEYGGCKDLFP